MHGAGPEAPPDGASGPERRGPRPETVHGRVVRFQDGARDFIARVYRKAEQDNIFFLAGAIAFNVVVAVIPLMLVVVGIAGTLIRLQSAEPAELLLEYIIDSVPAVEGIEDYVRSTLSGLLEQTTSLLSIGTLFLLWIATRLVGTLRTVLREIFDIHQDRGFVAGKLFDIKMVLAAGTLFALNVGLTVVLDVVARFGVDALGLEGGLHAVQLLYARVAALVTIWIMFLLIYRFLPARRIGWGTALIAATFTALLFELMKEGFSWYVTNVAAYGSTYGTLVFLAILVIWIYYSAVVFILGGEVAQVVAMRRTRRRQKERLT